jgi:hypothetical protein
LKKLDSGFHRDDNLDSIRPFAKPSFSSVFPRPKELRSQMIANRESTAQTPPYRDMK